MAAAVVYPQDVVMELPESEEDEDSATLLATDIVHDGVAEHVADDTLYGFLGATCSMTPDQLEATAYNLCHSQLLTALLECNVPRNTKGGTASEARWGRHLTTDAKGRVCLKISGELTELFSRTRAPAGALLRRLVDASLAFEVLKDCRSQRPLYNHSGVAIVYLIENAAERAERERQETAARQQHVVAGAAVPGLVMGAMFANPLVGLAAAGVGALATHLTEKIVATGAHQIHPSVWRILDSYIVYMEVRAYHLVRDPHKRRHLNSLRGFFAQNTMRAGQNMDHHYILCETLPLGQARGQGGASTWLLLNNDSDGHIVMKAFDTSEEADLFTIKGRGLFDALSATSPAFSLTARLKQNPEDGLGRGAALLHKKNLNSAADGSECWTQRSVGIHCNERSIEGYYPKLFREDVAEVLSMRRRNHPSTVMKEFIAGVHEKAARQSYGEDVCLDHVAYNDNPKAHFHTTLLGVRDLRLKTVRELVYHVTSHMPAIYSLMDNNCQVKSAAIMKWYRTVTAEYDFVVQLPS